MDRALEAVEDVRLLLVNDLERAIVIVPAGDADRHGQLLDGGPAGT
jgi:hypothetical protein